MGGGSGGSLAKPSTVFPLGRVQCQKVTHICKGIYCCSEVPKDLWMDYRRYDYDFETFRQFWNQRQEQNELEEGNPFGYTAASVFLPSGRNSC